MAATEEQEQHMKEVYEAMLEDDDPLRRMQAYVMSRGISGINRISRIFKKFDASGNRKLEFWEFSDAMEEYGVTSDKNVIKEMFDAIDADGTGFINFDEFLIALRPPLSDSRLEMINSAFDKFDVTGSGTVTIDDIRGIYSADFHPKYQSGEWTEDEVLQNWLDQFTTDDGDYEITKTDFVNYYIGVSSSIDDDEYFEEMMKSAWKM